MEITYAPKFARQYKKLDDKTKEQAKNAEVLFRQDIFHSKLKTHKLHGKLDGCWSFSIGFEYRIIFQFKNVEQIEFLAVGSHDIYE